MIVRVHDVRLYSVLYTVVISGEDVCCSVQDLRLSFNSYNVYANPNMEIIYPSDNVLDLGIFMSSNCSFEFHIQNLCKKMFKLVWLDLKNL